MREHVAAGGTTILVPLGSCERHGNPFTPLGLDSIVALALVERAAERSGVLNTPAFPFGYAPHHVGRAGEGNGTVTLRSSTYRDLVSDVVESLVFQGFDRVVLVTSHSFNVAAVEPVLIPLRRRTAAFVAVYGGRESDRVTEILDSPADRLASDVEASLALALLGGRFDADDYLTRGYEIHAPEWLGPSFTKRPGTGLSIAFRGSENITVGLEDYEFARPVSHGGPVASTASAAKGSELLDAMADDLAAFVEEVKAVEVEVAERSLDWRD